MKQTSRQAQKEQTQKTLLQAAYTVFCRQGIMAARMGDIAREANVSHGTVFSHFATQEALITEVVESYGREIILDTHQLSEGAGGLAALLKAHVSSLSAYEPFYTRLLLEQRLLPQAARDSFVAIQSALALHFINAASREGVQSVPPASLFQLWIGLVHHYLMNGDLFAPEGHVLDRYGDALVETYMTFLTGGKKA